MTDGVGFDYEVAFKGDYPAPFGRWPQLEAPGTHLGKTFGRFQDCEPWEASGGLPTANISAATTSLELAGECALGRRDQQTILALAYSPLDGSFSVSFRGSNPVTVPLSTTARDLETLLNAELAPRGQAVVVVDRVTHRHHPTGRFGVAWVVEFEAAAASSSAELEANGGAADGLTVSDAFTTGQDATVAVYRTVTVQTSAQRDDLRGHFRLQLGGEVTEKLSYEATGQKVVEALERLDQVASVEVLSGDVGFGVKVRVPRVELVNGSNVAAAAGDWTKTLAPGDELDFTRAAAAAKRKSGLASFGYFGFYSERLYGSTESAFESAGVLITALEFDNETKRTFFTLDEPFVGNATVAADAQAGNSERSLRPVSALVKLEEPPAIKFTYPTLAGRRTWVELCSGCASDFGVGVNQTITIERETYVVFGIGVPGLPSCGADCLLLDRPFRGTPVSHGEPYVPAFPATMRANTTADLGRASGDALGEGDRLFVATAKGELDELVIESLGPRPGAVTLSGNFTERYVGAAAWASAHGLRRRIVFRALADGADLDTFQAAAESDWRGTEARLEVRRPRGVSPLTATLGHKPEVQTLAIRCKDLTCAAALRNTTGDGGAHANATWRLKVDHVSTAPLPWGASASDVKKALEALRTVGNVAVERSGDEASPYFHFGYVYTVRFWGGPDQGIRGFVPELLFLPGGAMAAPGSGISHFVDTVQQGAANAARTPLYTALESGTTYYARVKALNAEGWGGYSSPIAAATAEEALLPGPPTAVSAGTLPPSKQLGESGHAEATSMSVSFAPPLQDGGAGVTHYKVEWSSDATFLATGGPAASSIASAPKRAKLGGQGTGKYGSVSLQVVHEVQSLVVDFRSGPDLAPRGGTFTLRWGGQRTRPLAWDVSPSDLGTAVQGISAKHLEEMGENAVHATRVPLRHGYRWDVTFSGKRGDMGLLEADGTELYGDDPSISGQSSPTFFSRLISLAPIF